VLALIFLCTIAVNAFNTGETICTTTGVNYRDAPCGNLLGTYSTGISKKVSSAPTNKCCFGDCYNWIKLDDGNWAADKFWQACGGNIGACDRNRMISRAQDWVNRGIMYSQSAYTDGYRQDCSGYVSMCLELSKPGPNTYAMLAGGFNKISKSQILIGDILLSSGHVTLFGGWVDSSQTNYWCFEEAHSGIPARKRSTPYPYWPGYGTYEAYRKSGC